jgi:SAM-dependent methyltransferase
MRTDHCPICSNKSPAILQLHFGQKMRLPEEVSIGHCVLDNFLFVTNGDQDNYDEYYKAVANDSYHAEIAGVNSHSPIATRQRDHVLNLLGEFLVQPRTVLDFGCGEAWLLLELASKFPRSSFLGFDPSPGAQIGSRKATALGLSNLHISSEKPSGGAYDLLIASHVLEHLIDFNVFGFWKSLLSDSGFLYVEVPDALQYPTYERLEFMYYFDRIHVNHFTPESLAQLLRLHGFGYVRHAEYEFPYRDGKNYPALGMLFRKGGSGPAISSPRVKDSALLYISREQQRANLLNRHLRTFDGVLVWGAGDNFYRSSENRGPLADLTNLVIMDKRPQVVTLGSQKWNTEIPADAMRRYPWPVVITVSEGRKAMRQQVTDIDPSRQIFFL